MPYKKKGTASGNTYYYKTSSDFVECPDGTSLTSHIEKVQDHIANQSNPHKVTLAQLGYSESSLISKVIDMLYPVNSIKLTWSNVNPGTKLAGTTWQLVSKGRYIRGVNPDVEDATLNKNTTGGSSTTAIGNHTHTLSSHTHTGPSHTHSLSSHTHSGPSHSHTLSSHTHSGPSHTHTIGAHSHVQTFGADDGYWYFMAGGGEWSNLILESTWRSVNGFWGGKLEAPGTGAARLHRTQQKEAYASGAAGTGNTGGPSTNSTGAAGTGNTGAPSNNTSGAAGTGNTGGPSTNSTSSAGSHNVTVNPPYQTLYVWRRTA